MVFKMRLFKTKKNSDSETVVSMKEVTPMRLFKKKKNSGSETVASMKEVTPVGEKEAKKLTNMFKIKLFKKKNATTKSQMDDATVFEPEDKPQRTLKIDDTEVISDVGPEESNDIVETDKAKLEVADAKEEKEDQPGEDSEDIGEVVGEGTSEKEENIEEETQEKEEDIKEETQEKEKDPRKETQENEKYVGEETVEKYEKKAEGVAIVNKDEETSYLCGACCI